MFTQITYSRPIEEGFLGRNGAFKMKGINVEGDPSDGSILLTPETSKGDTGRAWMRVPVENIDEFILALQDAKSQLLSQTQKAA